jgi:predicted ABC-type transport system involved in lysophospholipase L1 biosynthesis ATPase subunit
MVGRCRMTTPRSGPVVSDPLVLEIDGLRKQHGGLRPLRLTHLVVRRGDALAIHGLDVTAAEAFSLVVTGASVPDEGDVRVFGTNTRDIATDMAWLESLDRLGLVTERAMLIDQLPVIQNLALPLTLAIDPLSPETRERVHQLARETDLPHERLDAPAGSLSPLERMRVHLARAVALGCEMLLLEHPTVHLGPEDARHFGATLRRLAKTRGFAWVAMTEDEAFSRASGARRVSLAPATGALVPAGGFWRRLIG